jgi:outer membrane protein OmpA-like peptidoglycan-associated protein
MIVVNENDIPAEAKMFITNKEGKKVMEVNRFRNDAFKFEALSSDEIEQMPIIEEKDESLLTISVYGQIYDQLPGDYSGGMDVYVVNDKGIIIGTAKTDKDGKFVFEKLPPDEQYLFKLSEEKDLNIIILDENGEVIDSPKRKGKGYFVYTRLSGDDVVLTLINEDDVVIKIREDENFVISNIYYDYNSAEIKESAAKELDKLVLILKKNPHIGVELSSHTDSRGGDDFNLSLSQKRAEKAVQYIVGKGIELERMKGVGYGETKLVNKCSNGVECTEEEHGKNRRTEFKVYKVK